MVWSQTRGTSDRCGPNLMRGVGVFFRGFYFSTKVRFLFAQCRYDRGAMGWVGNDSEPPPIRAYNDGCTRMDGYQRCLPGSVHLRTSTLHSITSPYYPFSFLSSFSSTTTTTVLPRPPRASFTALAAILTLGTFLLFRRLSTPPAFYRDAFDGYDLGRSLRTWLRNEDARYAEVVRARQELMKKWGPTEVQVES